jgi:hypothetical protein
MQLIKKEFPALSIEIVYVKFLWKNFKDLILLMKLYSRKNIN